METYLQHQRPTDETTLINMILRKWMIFWQCHTIFRITYSLYIYAQRRNKESYFKLCKQGIKAQKS